MLILCVQFAYNPHFWVMISLFVFGDYKEWYEY
jgi:hypothetical protein